MINFKDNLNNIEKCYLEFKGTSGNTDSIDVFSIQLMLSIGQFPSCAITISEASKKKPSINDSCKLILKLDNKEYILFSGYIAMEAQSIAASAAHISGYTQYQIAIETEGIDSIPPVSWVYLTNATDIENSAVQGYTLVGNNVATGATKALGKLALNSNIAEVIVKTMDELQNASTSGEGSGIASSFTYGDTKLNTPKPTDTLYYITDKATALIKGGASYIQAIQALCDEFYLTLLPKYSASDSAYKMYIDFKPAWGRKSSHTITLSDYTGSVTSNTSIRNREIDGVIMPYWDTTGINPTNLGQYAFYGRKKSSSGAIFEIMDHKTLNHYFGKQASGLRYKQIPIPTWLAKGLSTSELQKAVRGVVKSYFATHAYTQRKINLDIPLVHYLNLTDKLGDIITVQALTDTVEGQNKSSTTKNYIGQLNSLALSLNFIQSKLVINCTCSLSYVRTEADNKAMNVTASDLMYK